MLYDVTVCDRYNPIGLDKKPAFSWKIKSEKSAVRQVSYEITVKNTIGEIVWQSGKVISDSSIYISYEGKELSPRTEYSADIEVMDNKGDEHKASTHFETGLLNQDIYPARWICDDVSTSETLPVFSKTVCVTGEIYKARFYGTACGVYELAIDGMKAGDEYLAPGWTSYHNMIQYQTIDVTDMLNSGNHEISLTVAPGWYCGYLNGDGKKGFYGDKTTVKGLIIITFADGKEEVIATDESWHVKSGVIRSSELYHGEVQDYTQNSSSVHKASLLSDTHAIGKIVSQQSEPVRIIKRLKAKRLIITPKKEVVIDFGQNLAGFVEVILPPVAAKANKKHLIIRHAEVLDRDGNFYTTNLRTARSTDEYIYKNDMADKKVSPHFTYHGFRYIEILGLDETDLGDEAELISRFTSCAICTDMAQTGTFSCDNKRVNRLWENVLWGQRSNFVDLPTDCPQRDERLGWTGDAAIFCETGTFNYFTKLFFEKWIGDVRAETDDSYGVPHIVPSIVGKAVGTAVWSDCATIVPWQMYMSFGDKEQLRRDYPLMKQWVEYIYRQCNGSTLWLNGFQRGDWLALDAPKSLKGLMSGGTDKNLVANVFYAWSTSMVRDAAGVLGYNEDAKKYEKRYEEIKLEINAEYVTKRGRLVSETQTACALLLYFDLLEEGAKPVVRKILKENLIKHKNHLTTGFVGTAFLLHALSENGMHDIAEEVFYQDDYPGWFYALSKDATTIWERWDSIKEDGTFDESGMNSFNHYSYGTVASWLYKQVIGIRLIEPGYKKFYLAPTLTQGMTEAEGNLRTVYGDIYLKWICRDRMISVEVRVPENTSAILILPEREGEVELGSGTYSYSYETSTDLLPQKYSRSTTLADILDDDNSAAVLYMIMPDMKNNPMMDFLKGKTLSELEELSPDSSGTISRLLMALNET